MSIPYAYSGGSMILYLQGQPYPIDKSHHYWDAIIAALPTATEEELLPLVSVKTFIASLQIGKVTIGNDEIYYDGKVVHSHLTDRMLEIHKAGLPIESWARFMDHLYQNPSKQAVDELYLWLEKARMPITEDGHFLAYKKVKDDYKSFHDGTTDNSVGTTPSMPRNEVDDRRQNTCSQGLHFCSWDYLPHYYGSQGKVVVLKINPSDVVSIPNDYDNAKGRAWQYLVWSEIDEDKARFAFPEPVVDTSPEYEEVSGLEIEDDDDDDDTEVLRGEWEDAVIAGRTELGFTDWVAKYA